MTKTATPKQTKITVSKLSHRLSRNGWISYNCELRKGRTCLASIDQEGVGGDERVAWNNTEHYLLIHHWILDTQRDFWREYEVENINYMVELGHKTMKDSIKEKLDLMKKFNLWEKLAKKKPKSWKEAREIQQKLGFFDDMVGSWTTVYVENKLADKYYD